MNKFLGLVRMVERHGEALTITQITSGTYDPSTGTNSPVEASVGFTGYFYSDNNGLFTEFDVVRGTRALVIPFTKISVVPVVGNTVTGQRDTVKITSVNHIMSGSNPVCYVLGTSE